MLLRQLKSLAPVLICLCVAGVIAAFNCSGSLQQIVWLWLNGLLLASLLIVQLLPLYPTRVGRKIFAIATGVLVGCLFLWGLQYLAQLLLPHSLHTIIFDGDVVVLFYAFTIFCTMLIAALNESAFTLHERKLALKLAGTAAEGYRNAALKQLHYQLQPHFLFNSLNSINALVVLDAGKAQVMVGRLAELLRLSIRINDVRRVSLSDELEYLQLYLSIETIRFADRLSVNISAPDKSDALLPPLLLQPLVENAIKHGLYGNTGKVEISIAITFQASMLTISISNPCDPAPTAAAGAQYGLRHMYERLLLEYGRADLLNINRTDETFTVTLLIPQLNVQGTPDR